MLRAKLTHSLFHSAIWRWYLPQLRWLLACIVLVAGCKLNERPNSGGGLIIGIDSDMATPKDLDQLRVEVMQSGNVLVQHDRALADGIQSLPIEYQIPRGTDSSKVLIRAIGLKEGAPRVERSVITEVPKDYLGYVRVKLSYLCVGQVSDTGASSCGDAQTCVRGACASAELEDPLPDYFTAQGKPSPTEGETEPSECFDVAACLGDATEKMPDPTMNCSFEYEPFANNFNVALRLELGSAGVCTQSACWIVLDSDTEGYLLSDSRVYLPPSVCAKRDEGVNLRVAVSMSDEQECRSKTQAVPVCRSSTTPTLTEPDDRITVGMSMVSPIGDACAGPGTRACEMCGNEARMCQGGLWSEFGTCVDQGLCERDVSESCGAGGFRSCGGDCTWGACENQPCEGPATRACGNCGTQRRTCDNGQWSEWTVCSGEGACAPGATQPCGSGGVQACGGSCQWGPCSDGACEGPASGACGNCGTRARVCDVDNGQWSEWGECTGEGVCQPDTTMSCGRGGTQTCGGNCQWDVACNGQMCEGPATQSCGDFCGTQTRTCDMTTGEWSDWSACFGEGECQPDSVRTCGLGGTQTCRGNCRWDAACTGQVCQGPNSRRCGNCGFQTRACDSNSGRWSAWGACVDEGDCAPGTNRTCGSGGTQTCLDTCRWDTACPDQECSPGPTQRECLNCGTQTRACNTNTGSWTNWSECVGSGCRPEETRPGNCGPNRQQTCSDSCSWSDCACSPGFTGCGNGTCFDLRADASHCGACGTVCATGQSCVDSVCRCPTGTDLCDGQCVNLAVTRDHCGTCSNACGGGAQCQGGQCACPSRNGIPQLYCEGPPAGCVDSQTDPNNCGRCGNVCSGGRECRSGTCQCPEGMNACNGVCTDVSRDNANCGSCGEPCESGEICVAGACVLDCPSGQTDCGSCVDLQSNNQHCGACRTPCTDGARCQSGNCSCPEGTTQCMPGGACIELGTLTNCTACGDVCATGAACGPNGCSCPVGEATCGTNACIDLSSSEAHCRTCGNACPTDATCEMGVCTCARGLALCGDACVNTQSDGANCGECGRNCGDSECRGGNCGCNSNEQECDGVCFGPSRERCENCLPCPGREGAIVSCSSSFTCEYTCASGVECGDVCCEAGDECLPSPGEGLACRPPGGSGGAGAGGAGSGGIGGGGTGATGGTDTGGTGQGGTGNGGTGAGGTGNGGTGTGGTGNGGTGTGGTGNGGNGAGGTGNGGNGNGGTGNGGTGAGGMSSGGASAMGGMSSGGVGAIGGTGNGGMGDNGGTGNGGMGDNGGTGGVDGAAGIAGLSDNGANIMLTDGHGTSNLLQF